MSARKDFEAKVLLVATRYSRWTGVLSLDNATISVNGNDIDDESVRMPPVHLITKHYPVRSDGRLWHEAFSSVLSHVNSAKELFTFPSPLVGVRQLAKGTEQQYRDRIDFIRSDHLQPIVDEFVDSFDEHIVPQWAAKLSSAVWNQVVGKIPSGRELRPKFGLSTAELRVGELFEVGTMIQESLDMLLSGVREEIAVCSSALRDVISNNRRITAASFAPLQRAIEKVKMFEFALTPTLASEIEEVGEWLSQRDIPALREDDNLRSAAGTILGRIIETAKQELASIDVPASALRRNRRIDVRPMAAELA